MAPLHRVYFLGNVMQDPEVWDAPDGTAVVRWGLAVPTRLRQGATSPDDVCCVEVTAFGPQAEAIKASLRKGRMVLIEGRVQWWRAVQGGLSRRPPAVIAERIRCLSRPQEETRAAAGARHVPLGGRVGGEPAVVDALPV